LSMKGKGRPTKKGFLTKRKKKTHDGKGRETLAEPKGGACEDEKKRGVVAGRA